MKGSHMEHKGSGTEDKGSMAEQNGSESEMNKEAMMAKWQEGVTHVPRLTMNQWLSGLFGKRKSTTWAPSRLNCRYRTNNQHIAARKTGCARGRNSIYSLPYHQSARRVAG